VPTSSSMTVSSRTGVLSSSRTPPETVPSMARGLGPEYRAPARRHTVGAVGILVP
jgi:hypothetical protein